MVQDWQQALPTERLDERRKCAISLIDATEHSSERFRKQHIAGEQKIRDVNPAGNRIRGERKGLSNSTLQEALDLARPCSPLDEAAKTALMKGKRLCILAGARRKRCKPRNLRKLDTTTGGPKRSQCAGHFPIMLINARSKALRLYCKRTCQGASKAHIARDERRAIHGKLEVGIGIRLLLQTFRPADNPIDEGGLP